METDIPGDLDGRRQSGAAETGEHVGGDCPVSGAWCEDYRDCKSRNYCWLKTGEIDETNRDRA
jgi:hypothetical protein